VRGLTKQELKAVSNLDIKSLGDVVASLSDGKAAALSTYLKDTYGIEAVVAQPTVRATQTTASDDEARDEPGAFDVVLTAAGDKKIQVIKIVRQHTSLGLKEAKDLVEGTPAVIKAGLPKEQAEQLRKELVEQGAKVELR
jgi:large subunit ribosomal protein L7/L12